MHTRRAFLLKGSLAAGMLASLTACQATTVGGVTTVVVDVAEAVRYIKLSEAIAQTALGFSGVPAVVSSAVDVGITAVNAGLDGLQKAAGSSITLVFDRSSPPAALVSVIADIQKLASGVSAAAAGAQTAMASTVAAEVELVTTDVANVAALLESMVTPLAGASVATARVGGAEYRATVAAALRARHGLD